MNDSPYLNRKEVILGTLRNLDTESIQPFFDSLKRTGYNGDVVMFCNSLSQETLAYLRSHGVKTIPFRYWAIRNHQPMLLFWPLWKRIIALLPGFKAKAFVARRVWFLFYLRFLMYYEFLLQQPKYSRVMITDVRDVWFQKNPFEWMRGQQGVFCFEELEGRTIGKCPSNSVMMYEAVGSKKAKLMANLQISCAGVTLGTRNEIIHYLKRFCELAFNAYAPKTSTGSDQGIHNWIIYQESIPSLRLINNSGPVYTMGLCKENKIVLSANGQVVNSCAVDGIPPVLHQYDRFPKVTNRLLESLELPR
jgi:hypothetical protein